MQPQYLLFQVVTIYLGKACRKLNKIVLTKIAIILEGLGVFFLFLHVLKAQTLLFQMIPSIRLRNFIT